MLCLVAFRLLGGVNLIKVHEITQTYKYKGCFILRCAELMFCKETVAAQ